MKRATLRLAAAALSLLLCVLCLPLTASAYTELTEADLKRECSLTIDYPGSDAKFRIYRVADLSTKITFQAVGDFQGFPKELSGKTGWTRLVDYLQDYVEEKNISPLATGTTNSKGSLTFSGLKTGLYLVLGDPYKGVDDQGRDVTYTPNPFLICLPNWKAVGEDEAGQLVYDWVYDEVITDKYTFRLDDVETVTRRVLKIWQDGGRTNLRPSYIEVDLLCNGQVYDTVRLTAANNWTYEWNDLDSQYRWRVEERTQVSGYTTRVSLEGITFTVTNTYTPPTTPPPTTPRDPPENPENPPTRPPTDPPSNPPGDPPDGPPDIPLEDPEIPLGDLPFPPDPDEPLDDGVYIDDMDVPLSNLPQTGQLWWPVPFLAIAGMFLIILGWGWNRRSRFEEEE